MAPDSCMAHGAWHMAHGTWQGERSQRSQKGLDRSLIRSTGYQFRSCHVAESNGKGVGGYDHDS